MREDESDARTLTAGGSITGAFRPDEVPRSAPWRRSTASEQGGRIAAVKVRCRVLFRPEVVAAFITHSSKTRGG